jgi:1,4-dihydroxy-2-naphthoate polyprenyltransferase
MFLSCLTCWPCYLVYISRAYSYRGIRLKKYPIPGYLTVIIFQGSLVFFLVMHGCSSSKTLEIPVIGLITAALLVGGFYPLTQIYQHEADKHDGVKTLSYILGYRGTFYFTAIVYLLFMAALGVYLTLNLEFNYFLMIQLILIPVLVYFLWWFLQVYKNTLNANFTNTMRMNIIGSVFTNAAFIYLFIMENS